MHSKTKHVPIKYHFLREQMSQKVVKLEYVDTKEQIANIFTKPLTRGYFSYLKQNMGVIPLPWDKTKNCTLLKKVDTINRGRNNDKVSYNILCH